MGTEPPAAEAPQARGAALRFLGDYGPRLGIFALLVAVGAALVGLRAHLKAMESQDVSSRLDAVLALPEADHDARIAPLRAILQVSPDCEAEPWVLLCLGNQLYKKAEGLGGGEAAEALNLEAYQTYLKVAEKHPHHTAAPLALFSAACCAEQMGRATDALRLYGDLKDRYPSTYLVVGSGRGSLREMHTEGLTERIQRLREAFPKGPQAAPPPPAATSELPAKP